MQTVLRIDPHHPQFGLLAPAFAQRVRAFADEYQPEVKPDEYVAAIMAKLWLKDPTILALGIVDEESAKLVGHALATCDLFGSHRFVSVPQIRADGNVGDARLNAIEAVLSWAKALGVEDVLLSTNRDGKDYEKRFGATRFRTLLKLSTAAA